ncbi:MAG TPA: DNA-3-methyladenine glycosylase [Steroidobacteraceae bacterium]|nr:DNA-3-methyladenine glycosylase [Steroidobacteraceae bacterium]
MPRKLPRELYVRRTLDVARELIGMHLVHGDGELRRAGRIVETEAYQGPHDLAAHSSRGLTQRTRVMFGPPGHAYVYLIYGFWNCLNVVTGPESVPHAVLLRALEPLRNCDGPTWGPGLLCRAMHIDRSLNGADLCGNRLWIEVPARFRPARVARGPRIGVDYAGDWAERPWRFYDRDSPYVSTVSPAARRRAGITAAARSSTFSTRMRPASPAYSATSKPERRARRSIGRFSRRTSPPKLK